MGLYARTVDAQQRYLSISMPENIDDEVSWREKATALVTVAKFDPRLTGTILGLGILAAALEGIGLTFIIPIIELVQTEGDPAAQADGMMAAFVRGYQLLGVPLTLGTAVVGVSLVMIVRYTVSYLVAWFREALRMYYLRDLQKRAFKNALNARVEYFDNEGSDDILNAIITQTFYAGRVIKRSVKFLEKLFLSAVYLGIAFVISPQLTVFAVVVLGGITVLLRHVIEPGYDLGDRVAKANERRQQAVQAGTQGIRDIRIFDLAGELFDEFSAAVEQYTGSQIAQRRNAAALDNFFNLIVAVAVFVLIYLALTFANLSLASLGVFLFAMFQLGPSVSEMNRHFYKIENDLPHLVRTEEFIGELEQMAVSNDPSHDVPDEIITIEFEDVWFSYDGEENVLEGVNFEVEQGEFVAFVGQSGAGKSTIVSLLERMYEYDYGEIRANGIPIDEMDIVEWRDHVSVVRQSPYVFNETLEYNVTIGNRDASRSEIERVCEIARVDEFIDELPNGYDTVLGDNGVRLSGGQKQRLSLARALLEDSDVLILDEATSDLDSKLEQEVQHAIETMSRDYAIITIAHRLSTVKNADRIYAVEDGQIVETGRHEELIERDGAYAELYARS